MKINGKSYDHYSLHVTINKTRQIENSFCNCKARKAGLCAHGGAALFPVIKIKKVCTSGDFKWKKMKFRDIQVQKDCKTLSFSRQTTRR